MVPMTTARVKKARVETTTTSIRCRRKTWTLETMVETGSPSRSSDVLPVAGTPRAVTMGLAAVRTVSLRRPREAESIEIAACPEPPAFRNWKSTLRQEVAAASGRPDKAFKWRQAFDRRSSNQLADPGELPTLDTKLGAGLQKAAGGDLALHITLA